MSLSLESSIRSLEEQAKSINSSYTKNTDLIGKGVDNLVGIFGGETVEKIYTDQILGIQEQAKSLLSKLHIETLTEEQRIRLGRLKDGKLEDVGIVQMTKNTDLKQAVVNGAYGVKGEITGTLHGLKVMITGVFDLAVFMGKYTGSMLGIHPEYKIKINEQATQLFDWMKKEGRVGIQDKVFELIEQEMTRISTLPQEDQAEAIGNIAGNIIGMLTGIKVGITLASKSGEMAGKVAQVARITEKLAKRATVNTGRITQVGNLGKQAGYIRMGATVAEKTLNGVAESLIGYGFAKGLSVTWELIRNSTASVSKKLSSIEKTIVEMEEALKTETNPTQQQSLQEEIRKLREEKVKIQRPDQSLDELKVNAGLSQDARIQKVRELLETQMRKLTKEQIDMIIHIHENISKGVFNNDYTTLKIMTKELRKVGLDEKDTRTLIENGILGSLEGGGKWGIDSAWLKRAERRIEGREGYPHQEPLEQPKQTIPTSQKIANINRRIGELEQALMEIDDPYLIRANKKQITLLRQKKLELERPGNDIYYEIMTNSGLSDEARLVKASELLGGKNLIEVQKQAILHVHNNVSKGVFQNGYSDLRQMTNELKEVGFSKDEIRKLMENGILGSLDDQIDAYLLHIANQNGVEYVRGGLRQVTENRVFLSKIIESIQDEEHTMKALQKFLNLEGQIFTDTNTWISSSHTGGREGWDRGFIRIGIGSGGDDLHRKMSEIPSVFGLKNGSDATSIKLRHELGHDITERYLDRLSQSSINELLILYGNKPNETISSMASAYSVYTSGGRRVQLGEDLAEMMSFYMRSPDKFEQFINTTIQSARGDERVRKLYESLSHHIKQAFIKYLSL